MLFLNLKFRNLTKYPNELRKVVAGNKGQRKEVEESIF